MSTEKYSSYTEAFKGFRTNIAENDFHDDYPETAEMTLAITSGLRYHYMHNYRSLTTDQSIQLIEMFAKRCAKLKGYKHVIDRYTYGSQRRMIIHKHWADDKGTGFYEWLLLCYLYGLIDLTYERKREIQWQFAYMNTWVKRNTIQLKMLDKDIKRRIEIQQKLSNSGKLVNRIDEFNHLFKFLHIPSIDIKWGDLAYKCIIDSYYDGQVDERLGMDTLYEWILNDDVDSFRQWYASGYLNTYSKKPRGNDKTFEFRANIASHILSSNAIKIIRFIIMNDIREFLNKRCALMDPWIQPVNDPECFRLLQEYFREEHKKDISIYLNNDTMHTSVLPENVYRFIKPEIATAMFNEIVDIFTQLTGESNICFCLFIALSIAKYGHIEPVESLDWDDISKRLCTVKEYTYNNSFNPREWLLLFLSRNMILSDGSDSMPFGMNPATAVYLHDTFAEHNFTRMQLDERLIDNLEDTISGSRLDVRKDGHITLAEFEEEEWICTDDELYC